MNLKIPPMPIRAASLAALALALLGGCKPHETHGTVDEANAITLEDIAKLGVEQARAKYAGKIVTFKGPLVTIGVGSKNDERKNVCMQSFLQDFPFGQNVGTYEDAAVRVYFNYGDEIDGWFESTDHRPEDLQLENPLKLDFDVCDTAGVCHEGDAKKECRFNTDDLLISGKIAAITEEENRRWLRIAVRPTGIRY